MDNGAAPQLMARWYGSTESRGLGKAPASARVAHNVNGARSAGDVLVSGAISCVCRPSWAAFEVYSGKVAAPDPNRSPTKFMQSISTRNQRHPHQGARHKLNPAPAGSPGPALGTAAASKSPTLPTLRKRRNTWAESESPRRTRAGPGEVVSGGHADAGGAVDDGQVVSQDHDGCVVAVHGDSLAQAKTVTTSPEPLTTTLSLEPKT